MSRVPAVFTPLMLIVALCSGARSAGADPIRVTSGSVLAGSNALGQPLDAEALVLTGAGLSIGSSLEDEVAFVRLATVPTVEPGAFIDLSGVLHVEDILGGFLNDSFALVSAPFQISFHAAPTPLACTGDGSFTDCIGVAPFTLNADLTITPLGGVPTTLHLSGGGTATGRLSRSERFSNVAVTYAIEANPTPEPGTLLLLATGLIGCVARARSKRL